MGVFSLAAVMMGRRRVVGKGVGLELVFFLVLDNMFIYRWDGLSIIGLEIKCGLEVYNGDWGDVCAG